MPIYEYATTRGEKRYRVIYRDPSHHQRQRRGFKRKKDAADYLNRVQVSIADNDYIDPRAGSVTVAELSKTWLAGKRGTVKAKYYRDLESAWNIRVEPMWGDRQVRTIRRSEVQEWVSGMSAGDKGSGVKGRSASVVLRAYGVLKGIMDMAVSDRILRRSPCEDIRQPHKVHRRRTYLTPAQVIALADAAEDHRALILTLGFCGLRWGEAAALRVRNVDYKRRRILVRESSTKLNKGVQEGPPKTWEIRDVPAPDIVLDAIREECRGKAKDARVFTDADGGRIREQSMHRRTWYSRALERSGVPKLTCHDLRHSAASIAISAGANVKAVQRMLGHKSAVMTLDVYGDLFDTDLDAVSDTMNTLIRSVRNGNGMATIQEKSSQRKASQESGNGDTTTVDKSS